MLANQQTNHAEMMRVLSSVPMPGSENVPSLPSIPSGQQGGGTTRNVSTHSRPKAAGHALENARDIDSVSTHSRPKAAGGIGIVSYIGYKVSTHSRPKAAGKTMTAFFA